MWYGFTDGIFCFVTSDFGVVADAMESYQRGGLVILAAVSKECKR